MVGLQGIAQHTDHDQHVLVWDPLLLTGLALSPDDQTWAKLCANLGPVATVLTAIMVDRHWYLLVWRMDSAVVRLFTCGVVPAHVEVFESLATTLGSLRGVEGQWCNKLVSFVLSGHCGALVLSFAKHLLWGENFPSSLVELESMAKQLRQEFASGLPDMCLRPQLAALGLTVVDQLAALLGEHGVEAGESVARAKDVIQQLGEAHVSAALQASNAWRELKWLANQQRPPLVLIKPSELQRAIEKRGGNLQVGNKRHKRAKGQGKGKYPPSLDATMLRLETRLFQDQQDQTLSQVAVASIGPQVSGVVVL